MLNNDAVAIGAQSDGGNLLDGRLDEVAIWDLELTEKQAMSLYHSSVGSIIPEPQALRGRTKVTDETENISEQANRLRGAVRLVDETLNISENLVSARGLVKQLDETLNWGWLGCKTKPWKLMKEKFKFVAW
jgi:hypothetical protein